MTDFIREVDEELRQDKFRNFLTRYWIPLLVLAILILAGVAGYRIYDYVMTQRAQEAGGKYLDGLRAQRDGKTDVATKAFEDVRQLPSPGYQLLARFSLAAAAGKSDAAAGAKQFDAIAADGTVDPAFQNLAKLRAGILLVDSLPYPDLKLRLTPLADANNGLRNSARELLAIAALKANQSDEAGKWLDAIETDPAASQALRQRADAMLGLVRAGSGDAIVSAPTPGSTAIPGLNLPTEATPFAPSSAAPSANPPAATPTPTPAPGAPAPTASAMPDTTPSAPVAPAANPPGGTAVAPAPEPSAPATPPAPAPDASVTPGSAPAAPPEVSPAPAGATPPTSDTTPNAAPPK